MAGYRDGRIFVGEMITLNLLISAEMTNEEIGELEEVSTERIAEIRKGMNLIGEDILKERFEAKRNLLLEQVIRINKQLKAGLNAEKIVDSGYPEWIVEQVYQGIFCGNRREENE